MYRRRNFLDPVRHWFRALPRRARVPAPQAPARMRHSCTEPISWTHGRDRRHGRHEILVTREIPSVVPLKDYLRGNPAQAPDLTALFAPRAPHARVRRRARRVLRGERPALRPGAGARRIPRDRLRARLPVFARNRRDRPAEYDVLDMLRSIETRDADHWTVRAGWKATDSAPQARRDCSRILRGIASSGPWRHIRRAETDTREFLDRPGRAAVP